VSATRNDEQALEIDVFEALLIFILQIFMTKIIEMQGIINRMLNKFREVYLIGKYYKNDSSIL